MQGREWAAKTMELGLQETGAPGTVLKDGKLMQKQNWHEIKLLLKNRR